MKEWKLYSIGIDKKLSKMYYMVKKNKDNEHFKGLLQYRTFNVEHVETSAVHTS